MEKKLTIAHLAPYLPYKLKVVKKKDYHSETWENGEVCTVFQIGEKIIKDAWFITESFFNIGVFNPDPNSVSNYESHQFKPLLRPLSDLTKEITHNGETFIPFEKVDIFKDVYSLKEEILTGFVPVIVFNMLCEWRFDVFSLIEDDLAVDLNTLNENPYK